MAKTLFERAGGFAAVRKVVSSFYDKVLDDDLVQHYFANVDMRRLIDHQTQFISSIMGGPATVSDDVIRKVHAPLAISQADYRRVAGLLRETFEDFDFDEADIDHVYREVLRRESMIVTKFD